MPLRSDVVASAARYAALQDYCAEHLLNSAGFRCNSEATCRASSAKLKGPPVFSAGQLSYVGTHLDLRDAVSGAELRTVVLGMETGRTDTAVTLDARRAQLAGSASLPVAGRNPHMRGTTFALRVVHGLPVFGSAESEYVDVGADRAVHLFDTFALVNVRLCSSTDGKTGSRPTRVMTRSCARHLRATLKVLAPTLLVAQSTKIPANLVKDGVLRVLHRVSDNLDWVDLGGREVLLASFTHPTAQNPEQAWSRFTTVNYLHQVVAPTLVRAREELGITDSPVSLTSTTARHDAPAPAASTPLAAAASVDQADRDLNPPDDPALEADPAPEADDGPDLAPTDSRRHRRLPAKTVVTARDAASRAVVAGRDARDQGLRQARDGLGRAASRLRRRAR